MPTIENFENMPSFDVFLKKVQAIFSKRGLRILGGEIITQEGLRIPIQTCRRHPKELWDKYDLELQLAAFIQRLKMDMRLSESRDFTNYKDVIICETFLSLLNPHDKLIFQPFEHAYLLLTACPLGLRMDNGLASFSPRGFCGIEDGHPFRYVSDLAPRLQICFPDYKTFAETIADKPDEILRVEILKRVTLQINSMAEEAGQKIGPSAWQILLPSDLLQSIEKQNSEEGRYDLPLSSENWAYPLLALCGQNLVVTDGETPARVMDRQEAVTFIENTCFPRPESKHKVEPEAALFDSPCMS